MIGDIYKLPIHDDSEGWIMRNLLVLELYQALPYNKSYMAARCLVLDTGQQHHVYADTLQSGGKKVV